jgi:hypothetical protein
MQADNWKKRRRDNIASRQAYVRTNDSRKVTGMYTQNVD